MFKMNKTVNKMHVSIIMVWKNKTCRPKGRGKEKLLTLLLLRLRNHYYKTCFEQATQKQLRRTFKTECWVTHHRWCSCAASPQHGEPCASGVSCACWRIFHTGRTWMFCLWYESFCVLLDCSGCWILWKWGKNQQRNDQKARSDSRCFIIF